MKQYRVQITDYASKDMEDIYAYIAYHLKSPNDALEQYNHIEDAIQSLNIFPERIKIMDSEPENTLGYRQLLVDNFSVLYVIEKDKVIVFRVLYSGCDISKRLVD